MQPLVSCIIPVYNAERYLERCLDSILAQDYPNMEIVLIDDGSTDRSGDICDEYQRRYENVVVTHIPNGGASLARRKGIELAKGEYVTFVDSDDYFSPHYVSELYALIEKFQVRISACNVKRVHVGEQPKFAIDMERDDSLLTFDELMPRFFKYEFWGFPGKLYVKSLFEGISFLKATLSEDYFVMMQLFLRERQMAYTKTPLYFYEYHENSLSHTPLSEKAFEEFDNVKAVYEKVKLECPKFADYALSNVVETAVKLYVMGSKDNTDYTLFFSSVDKLLKNNKKAIIYNRALNGHVKLMALGFSIFPYMTKRLCRILM